MYLLTTIMVMVAIAISCCVVEGSCSENRDAVTTGLPDGARERMAPPAPRGHAPLPSHRRLDGASGGRRPRPSPPPPHVSPYPRPGALHPPRMPPSFAP
ncbi:unnamed protein product [Urochloa humidicola]